MLQIIFHPFVRNSHINKLKQSLLLPGTQAEKSIIGELKVVNAAQYSTLYKGLGSNAGKPGVVNQYNNMIKCIMGRADAFGYVMKAVTVADPSNRN